MDRAERELFRSALHGDRDAFEMIIRQTSRQLFAIAYGILQNREEAEDVVQDSLVKAWKSRWRVRDPEKMPAWLGTIARHRAHDLLRRRRTVPLEGDGPSVPADAVRNSDDNNEARLEQVNAAMAELPELHRAALALRYFEKMDYAAIEQTLGLSNGALRGILGRALQTMRKNLRPALAAERT